MERSSQYRLHVWLYKILPFSIPVFTLLLGALNLYYEQTISLLLSILTAVYLTDKAITDLSNNKFEEMEENQLQIDRYKEAYGDEY